MAFQPAVGQALTIDDTTYRIAEHPAAPGIPYGQEGRQAIVTYDAFHTDATRALFALRRTLLYETDYERFTIPAAMLVYGRDDDTCSASAMNALFKRLPAKHKDHLALPRSNHHLLHDHDREQAIRAIVEFVGKP